MLISRCAIVRMLDGNKVRRKHTGPIYVWVFENGVNVNTTTLTLFPENTQDFSFSKPQTVCQHAPYSHTLLVSDWLAFGC